MGWLVMSKVLPAMLEGDPPDYSPVVDKEDAIPLPVCWRIESGDEEIGWAMTRTRRRDDGTVDVRSVVQFERLPMRQIVSEMLGTIGPFVRPFFKDMADIEVETTVVSQMNFDEVGHLDTFNSAIHLGELRDFIRLQGSVVDGELGLIALMNEGVEKGGRPRYREIFPKKEIPLPRNALMADAFSPRPKLANLHEDQRWTFPVFRPFPPTRPVEIVQAKVERHADMKWDGRSQRTFMVVYRSQAGTGITASREPVGRLWVWEDGTVLRQEVRITALRFTFERLTDGSCTEKVKSVGEPFSAD